jgi:hypothetical protein
MNEMVLICGNAAADRFTPAHRHAGLVPAWHGSSTPLPHACPNSYIEPACQSRVQPHGELAKHRNALTTGDANYELGAFSGEITHGQP